MNNDRWDARAFNFLLIQFMIDHKWFVPNNLHVFKVLTLFTYLRAIKENKLKRNMLPL